VSDHSNAGPLLARLARPRTESRHRIAIIADPHVTDGTGTWKVAHRSKARFERAIDHANSCDIAFLAGDLTGDGRTESFEMVETCLAALDVPWVAVPGNHDVPKAFDGHSGVPVSTFTDRYTPGLPFTWDLGRITLVGIDTATDGGRDPPDRDALAAVRESWREDVAAMQARVPGAEPGPDESAGGDRR